MSLPEASLEPRSEFSKVEEGSEKAGDQKLPEEGSRTGVRVRGCLSTEPEEEERPERQRAWESWNLGVWETVTGNDTNSRVFSHGV